MNTNPQTKDCANCSNPFTIQPEDFLFYEKIKVPPPTWCPECRLFRRMAWRNEHSLFRRPNNAPNKTESIISVYHPDANVSVYDKETWWGDSWDPRDYGVDYDFSISFFEQFKELMERVPHMALADSKSVNSRFCNMIVESKNTYLVTATWNSEDSMYCNRLHYCKFTHDCYLCFSTEFTYESIYCTESSRLFFSRESDNCLDSYFLYDCRNCSNCILSTNLRNKSYCIENIQYSREEYLQKKVEIGLHTRLGLEKAQVRFLELWSEAFHKHLKLTNTQNVIGDQVSNSRNCFNIFDFKDEAENSKYANWGSSGLKDSYDVGPGCGAKSELTYESSSVGVHNSKVFFGANIWYSFDIWYSYMLNNCRNCFGCVEMNNKEYCIFNKQYTKEEYLDLVPKIIEHMKSVPYIDKEGRKYFFGELFPPEFSPFAFNESIASDYAPMKKELVESKGYTWREYVPNAYQTTINGEDLPQTIAEVEDSILNEVIKCELTGKPFKITEQELSFYCRLNIPLPSVHPDERHKRRLGLRNVMKFNKRMCYFGDKEVDTTYLPVEEGGPQKVVCSEHYNQQIY